MKGISALVVVILLLLITISIVGIAFLFFQRTVSSAAESSEKEQETKLEQLGKQVRVDNAAGNQIVIRNVGTGKLNLPSDITVYINDVQSSCSWSTNILDSNLVAVCYLQQSCEGKYIKITIPSSSESLKIQCETGSFVAPPTTTVFVTTTTSGGGTTTIPEGTTTTISSTTTTTIPSVFVTREGTRLILNGNEFRFIGVTREGLASSYFFRFPNGLPVTDFDGFLDKMFTNLSEKKISVVRFWAFQSYADNNGTLDFSAIDNVINRAKAHGIKLIPVLENQWRWSTQGGDKDSTWYRQGYLSPYGTYTLSYKDYTQAIVTRYKDEPTILMWQLISEASLEQNPTYPTALYDFTSNMSSYVKSIDNNHLISIGVSGTGQPGTDGTNYTNLYNIADIDVVQAHDYNYPEEPLPGSDQSPRSQIKFELYVQDSKTPTPQWYSIITRQVTMGKWVAVYGNIPSTIVTPPITRAAINVKVMGTDTWSGPIYFDNIKLGSTTYDFESDLQGWNREGSSSNSTLKISNVITHNSSLGSLEVDINNDRTSNTRLYPVPLPSGLGGSQFIIYVYIPSDAPRLNTDTMYSDLNAAKSPAVNKPFVFGEAGIRKYRSGETDPNKLCTGPDCYPLDQRSSLFDAKINAAFGNGTAGYIIWYWDNSVENGGTSCDFFGTYCFDDKDPLVNVTSNRTDIFAPGLPPQTAINLTPYNGFGTIGNGTTDTDGFSIAKISSENCAPDTCTSANSWNFGFNDSLVVRINKTFEYNLSSLGITGSKINSISFNYGGCWHGGLARSCNDTDSPEFNNTLGDGYAYFMILNGANYEQFDTSLFLGIDTVSNHADNYTKYTKAKTGGFTDSYLSNGILRIRVMTNGTSWSAGTSEIQQVTDYALLDVTYNP